MKLSLHGDKGFVGKTPEIWDRLKSPRSWISNLIIKIRVIIDLTSSRALV